MKVGLASRSGILPSLCKKETFPKHRRFCCPGLSIMYQRYFFHIHQLGIMYSVKNASLVLFLRRVFFWS